MAPRCRFFQTCWIQRCIFNQIQGTKALESRFVEGLKRPRKTKAELSALNQHLTDSLSIPKQRSQSPVPKFDCNIYLRCSETLRNPAGSWLFVLAPAHRQLKNPLPPLLSWSFSTRTEMKFETMASSPDVM